MDIYCPTCAKFVCEVSEEGEILPIRHPCQHCRVNLIVSRTQGTLSVMTAARTLRLKDLPIQQTA